MSEENIELRSEEVQEILTRTPNWYIRWGNVIILSIVIILIIMSALVKYPDVIAAELTITTINPPTKILARSSGRIEQLFINNNQYIKKGNIIAVIENTADYNDIHQLKKITDTFNPFNGGINFPFQSFKNLKLGEIDAAYSAFEHEYMVYSQNLQLQPFVIEEKAQNFEYQKLEERLSILNDRKILTVKEQDLKKQELARYQKLYDKGVIATQEWETKNLDYLQVEKEIKNLNTSISQLQSDIGSLKKNRETTEINITTQKENLFKNVVHAFSHLKKTIAEWEHTYVMQASSSGRVTFFKIWKENQIIQEGETAFMVVPSVNQEFIGKAIANSKSSGKIEVGQNVNVMLDNFPSKEFGIIRGKVSAISLTHDQQGNLVIDVKFPDNLRSSYNKNLTFKPEMTGIANIVTDETSALMRIFHQFSDIRN